MIFEKIKLGEVYTALESGNGVVEAYIPSNSTEINVDRKRPTVVICPGGGYRFTSDREAEPVALRFMAEGFNAIVLRYSVAPIRYPQQLLEVAATVDYARKMEDKWNVDTENIIVCGFSAGGHLAASLGTLWTDDVIKERLGLEAQEVKPNKLILSYPVITSNDFGHQGSFDNLLGEYSTEEDRRRLSIENLISKDMPPTFIWHTFDDKTVPVQNSLLLASALTEYEVPFEMHIYPKGVHGLSLCEKATAKDGEKKLIDGHVASWFRLAIKWINLT